MPTIEFKITEGKAPFFAEILEGGIPLVYCPTIGTWFFNDVECGVSYTIRVTDAENCTVEFQAECECTTTVEPTTTEVPTTTSEPTTTVIEELPCNYYDTEYFTPFVTQKNYTLGADTGVVELYFNFFDIPARIVIEFDEGNVIDTGYRGNPAYHPQLNTALTSLGEPPAVISNTREGRLYFDKETATESAVMYIYAPISGAVVAYSLKCPADPVFAAAFTNYVCEQEEYVPTTTVELTTTEQETTTSEPVTTEQVTTTEQLLTTTVLFTTTEEVTTTVDVTTTEELTTTAYEYYDFGSKTAILTTVNQGDCGQEGLYPRATAFSILLPDTIIAHYLELNYTQMEYIKITSISSDTGVNLMYNGSEIQANDVIYSGGNQYTWDNGDVTLVAQSESESDLDVVLTYRIKATGYNETVEGYHTCRWNGCNPVVTTTEEVTTTI